MIWLQVPWIPIYFIGLWFAAIALCIWLGKHAGPSTETRLRESQQFTREIRADQDKRQREQNSPTP